MSTSNEENAAIEQAILQLKSIRDMVAALNEDDQDLHEAAIEAIQSDPLEVLVRDGWRSLSSLVEPEPIEFSLLLCTGGPAVRIVGDLEDGVPTGARLEYQDWGTPWTALRPLSPEDYQDLIAYASQFCYDE